MTTKNKTKADAVDMSPRAVANRLEDVRSLYKLAMYLRKFQPVQAAENKSKRS